MILEIATLDVILGQEAAFEADFEIAQQFIVQIDGYQWHELQRCIEKPNRYVLLVGWRDLESHTVGFRGSPQYQNWKRLLHHYYDPFPTVEHFEALNIANEEISTATNDIIEPKVHINRWVKRGRNVDPKTREYAQELRHNPTPAESTLWQHLRAYKMNGHKFRRQHPINRFIVDFCCIEKGLIIELDGDSHGGKEAYDQSRTESLKKLGYTVIRFTNEDIRYRLDAVLEAISNSLQNARC